MTFTVFSQLTGYTDESLYTALKSQIEDLIEVELGDIFTLTANATERYYGQNMDRVDVGAWQKTGLVVKLGTDNLTEFTDYKLQTYNYTDVVLGVTLNRIFRQTEYIELEGTRGWSNELPADIQSFIFDYVKRAYKSSENTKKNIDGLKMVENHSSKEAFDNTLQREDAKFLLDPLGSKAWKRLSRKYKIATNKVICSNTQ